LGLINLIEESIVIELTQEAVARAVETNDDKAFAELAELQLALVGGGIGNVLWG
jgi:hypothetical protein